MGIIIILEEAIEIKTVYTFGSKLYFYEDGEMQSVEVESVEIIKNKLKKLGLSEDEAESSALKHFKVDNLLTSKAFISGVECMGFIDYDGYIDCIVVDGYKTNLGLATEHLSSGGFMLGMDTFKRFCEEHEVYVSWVNK